MVERIKLDMDWCSWPTWGVDESGDFNPKSLPISQELLSDLMAWRKAYQDNYDSSCPEKSDFPNQEAADNWSREGMRLWIRMINELSSSEYEVFYPFRYHGEMQLFKHPNELPEELRDKWLRE